MEEKRLKPVIYTTNSRPKGSQNTTQQMFLIKALRVTNDPQKLKQMIGVRTDAEVFRTLDKLSMRKEYHAALEKAGVSFEFIVNGLRDLAEDAEKDGDKVKAFQILLKSLGMDKYDIEDGSGSGTWEDIIGSNSHGAQSVAALPAATGDDYHVTAPAVPLSAQKLREAENKMIKSIYD